MQRVFAILIGSVIIAATIAAASAKTTSNQESAAGGYLAAESNKRNIWDGIFTAEQVNRGREAYEKFCGHCHGLDFNGIEGPSLRGAAFLSHWMDETASVLFDKMITMPPGGEKPRSDEEYIDILTYILQANSFPAGDEELKAAMLHDIQITGRDGPGEVPNFALVETVGCIDQGTSATKWLLTHTGELRRVRTLEEPTPEELQAAKEKELGDETFVLLSPNFRSGFRIDEHKGFKMQVKGFLIRMPEEQRINVTWMEILASTCP